jgi:hypothetical protein
MQKPINPSTSRTAPATIIQSGYSIAESMLIRAPYFFAFSSNSTSRQSPAGSRPAGFLVLSGRVIYRHINIAINPDTPSVAAKKKS